MDRYSPSSERFCSHFRELLRLHQITRATRTDTFREIKILPQHSELIKNTAPSIQSNKVRSKYKDLEEYLDIQFRLLREDFMAPLREVISTCCKEKNIKKLKENRICRKLIFENVVINSIERRQFYDSFYNIYWLDLSVHRKKFINFEHCKRFLTGDIVCIFNITFTAMSICTVHKKQVTEGAGITGNTKDILEVGILGNLSDIWDSSKRPSYILVESPAFYGAYSSVLKNLQKINHIPFERNLLYCSKEQNPPAYLTQESCYDITAVMKDERKQSIETGAYKVNESCTGRSVKVLDRFSWGSVKDTLLNDSQLQALRHCLTRELAVVQGPPGTGKTFIAIKLAEVLLANRKCWSNSGGHGALLIVCQTNHALDQFLEGILKFNNSIIRIGKRCKSKILKNKLLDRILSGVAFTDMESEKTKEIEHLQDMTKYIEEAVIGIENFFEFGIITEDIVSDINGCGGMWKLLNIKSPEEVVEKIKAEVTNEIDQLKEKRIKGKKGKMKKVEVNIEMKVIRRRQQEEEKVVNILEKRKKTKARGEYVEIQKPLCLTNNSSFQDNLALCVERYVCTIYGYPREKLVNVVRSKLFDKKFTKGGKVIDMALLPPCSLSLVLHIKRANYVAKIWRSSLTSWLDAEEIRESGWLADGETYWVDDIFPLEIEEILCDQAYNLDDDFDEEEEQSSSDNDN
ncbi:NFX1-type zinc finger-containing protein 1 [Nymphon striatum]|nr:NFX1-type zinc finger-containing protein 1 [Nymphon striatum]